jgi:hypothetical protein
MTPLVIVVPAVGIVALVLLLLHRRSARAEGMSGERRLGNHYTGGDVHGTPPGQGWGGGPS